MGERMFMLTFFEGVRSTVAIGLYLRRRCRETEEKRRETNAGSRGLSRGDIVYIRVVVAVLEVLVLVFIYLGEGRVC
jgi:hypothetical protein